MKPGGIRERLEESNPVMGCFVSGGFLLRLRDPAIVELVRGSVAAFWRGVILADVWPEYTFRHSHST